MHACKSACMHCQWCHTTSIWDQNWSQRVSPHGGDAKIQGDMDLSTVLMIAQIQEVVKLVANCNKELLNRVKMKTNECGSSRL